MSEIKIALKGLNCPNCAGKIEKFVNRMNGVSEANLNLMNQEIVITYGGLEKDELIAQVRKVTNDLEPHVVVEEKVKRSSKLKAGPAVHSAPIHMHTHDDHDHSNGEHVHVHGEACECGHDHSHGEHIHIHGEDCNCGHDHSHGEHVHVHGEDCDCGHDHSHDSHASKITIALKGLNCPNCAGKIEKFVQKMDGVSEADLNLMNQEIVVSYSGIEKSELIAQVRKVTNDLEPHVVVEEKIKRSSAAKAVHSSHTHSHDGHVHSHNESSLSTLRISEVVIALKGLNCPNCAGKIEKFVQKMEGVSEANLNLMNQEIVVSYSGIDKAELVTQVRKVTNDLEPHVVVEEKTRRSSSANQAVQSSHIHEGHSHSHDHSHEGHSHGASEVKAIGKGGLNREMTIRLAKYAVGFVFFVMALMDIFPQATMVLFLASYALFGTTVLIKAFNNIIRGEIFDENFLMCVSTIGAFAIGEYPEAVAVMVFYQIGEFFQDLAVDRSRDSIKSLMNLKADYANLESNGEILQVDPLDISVGDIIVVKPGEKIPLDGVVIEGKSQVDMSSLIGESVPRSIGQEDGVLSGAVNLTGILRIEVTKDYDNSTVAKILDMVENASGKKAPTEKFITKFSKVYTPAVCITALILALVPPLVIPGALFSDWVYRGLVFLVVSCPCALVISVPLSFFSGIGYSSKKGILVKGTTYIEALNKVNTVVFDKTGTLTRGVFTVTGIFSGNVADESTILEAAYNLEKNSNHPIAKSIVREYNKRELCGNASVSEFEEISGQGLKGIVNGETVLAGNSRLMENNGIAISNYDGFGTVVHVSQGNKYLGYIEISDIVKEDSAEAIRNLRAKGIRKIAMVSGDKKETAEKIAKSVGIDEVFAELLPHEKINAIEKIYVDDKDAVIAFAGDGINDAPVLARVDVGIAMGGVGSDAAIEAADIVIMTDEPSKISDAIDTAGRTMKIVKQNIAFALIIKFGVLGLSVFGRASMWLAVFADVGVALIAVINAMRAK